MYVLDTNVISELRSGKPLASPAVRTWAASVASSLQFVSVITLMELEQGILSLERKKSPKGSALRIWFELLRTAFEGRILPFTEAAALHCAKLHAQRPRSGRDSMIASTAAEHGFIVVTRNVRDFEDCGASVLDPWQPA